jgi:hypothetical protein
VLFVSNKHPLYCVFSLSKLEGEESGLDIGWLWSKLINMAAFKPYGKPPPFDLDEYKDSFELWHKKWTIFLSLSTIDSALV